MKLRTKMVTHGMHKKSTASKRKSNWNSKSVDKEFQRARAKGPPEKDGKWFSKYVHKYNTEMETKNLLWSRPHQILAWTKCQAKTEREGGDKRWPNKLDTRLIDTTRRKKISIHNTTTNLSRSRSPNQELWLMQNQLDIHDTSSNNRESSVKMLGSFHNHDHPNIHQQLNLDPKPC